MAPEQGPSKTASQASEQTLTDMTTRPSKIPVPSPEGKQTLSAEAPTQTQPPNRSSSPRPARKVRTSWVASLNKRELVSYLRESGIDDQGVVEELRRRLSTYINGGNYDQAQFQRFAELEQRHNPATSAPQRDTTDQDMDEPAQLPSTRLPALRDADQREGAYETPHRPEAIYIDDRTFDRVRSWAIRFNEDDSAIDFVDRLEELATSQRVVLDQVPFTLSEVLKGEALAWWRNRRAEWTGWQDFRNAFLKHFLPNKFFSKLEDTVRQRTQQRGEPFRQYAVALESLMRHLQPTRKEKLDRIYTNSQPSTRLLIKRSEFQTLDELTELVSHLEATQAEVEVEQTVQPPPERQPNRSGPPRMTPRAPQRPPPRNHQNPFRQPPAQTPSSAPLAIQAPPVEPGYVANPSTVCRQCSEPGHQQRDCRRARVLFCWTCGKVGVRTIHCCPNGVPTTQLRGTRNAAGEVGRVLESSKRRVLHLTDIAPYAEGIKATVRAQDDSWEAIIDTGSWNSFVSPGVAKNLQAGYATPYETMVRVIMADGQHQDVTEGLKATLRVDGKTHRVRFLVMPMATDTVILGMDALQVIGTTMRIGKTKVHFRPRGMKRVVPEGATMQQMTTQANTPRLTSENIDEFLQTELGKFANISGPCTVTCHRITMKNDQPIKQRYQPRNPAMQKIINEKIDELLEKGCIEPSNSPYSAPIVLVRKKNGQWRMCVDYRQLNANSVTDAYPLPRIQHNLCRLRNAKVISSLDLKDGYWQIPMHPDSQQYTAFTVPGRGLFQWKVMPFGLHSAPATFQRALDQVIGPDLEPHAFAYLDDIIVTSSSPEEHVRVLAEVFRRLRAANLRLNPEKCDFFKKETKYLGHVISADGIHTDPDKIAAIKDLPAPTNIRELRRCLGIASWYRRYVPDFHKITRAMTELLKKGKHFHWGERQQEAFVQLKERLTNAPVLACPDFTQTFKLQTDASNHGLGAVLTQELEGKERVIAYASRQLLGAESNYSATEKECLAIVWGIRKMREFLEGYHFVVVTDHLALKWLNSIETPSGRVARWALELQQYDFEVQYRRGKLNVLADALSRQPQTTVQRIQSTPLGTTLPWPASRMQDVQNDPQKFPEYAIENGRLYRYFSNSCMDEDTTPWKLCVSKEDRARVLQENHDVPTAGHQGIRKTIGRVANHYYWPGMFRDISRYVRGCQQCQRYKSSQQAPAGHMLTQIADEPWSTLCIDFVGPLPRSKHGNTMLLVIQDKFSKWVEIAPLRAATTDHALRVLRTHVLARFGIPKKLISDNGRQFTSNAFRQAMEDLGIQHQYTAPYTPQENAVERANRVIKTMLAQYCEGNQRTWDEWVPEIMLAINTGVSESTGNSPAFIVQGRHPRLPKTLFDEVTPGSGQIPDTSTERHVKLRELYQLVRHNLQVAAQEQARHYNARHRSWKPEIGDQVWVREHHLSKAVDGFAAKLAPKFEGPFQVINFKSPVIVEVKLATGTQRRTVHIRDLKVYHPTNDNSQTDHPTA